MKLNKGNVQRILHMDAKNEISGENGQLVTVDNMNQFLDITTISSLNLGRNHLKEIEPIFSRMSSLKSLNLSMNHLRFITYLDSLANLQFLDLSTNRIIRADKLNSCKNLRILDLSMNYIEEMEELDLPYLEQLYLQGNKLTHLSSLANLPRLRFFDVSKNDLSDINPALHEKSLKYLEKLKCAYNKMPSQYLEDFCFILSNLPNLLELDTTGNELTIHPLYRSSVLTAKRLRILDGLDVDDTTIEQIQVLYSFKLRNTDNFEQAIVDTNKDYMNRLSKENDAKRKAKKLLQDQMDRIDDMFDNFQKKTEKDQMHFMEYIAIMEKRYRQGDKIQLDEDTIKLWRLRIQDHEKELSSKIGLQKQIQDHQRDVFLQKELNGLTLREKLYDIALNNPELWRDLKSKELEQVYREEKRNEQREIDEMRQRMRNGYGDGQMDSGDRDASRQQGMLEEEMRQSIAAKIQGKLQMIEDYSRDQKSNYDEDRKSVQNLSQSSMNDIRSVQQKSVNSYKPQQNARR